ncbi:hypothetical protein PVA45_00170 [Entomospira entomophila]|uniref:Tetratricopeptide repeat protein n=1 Tax=Entomospira entomophila TaxID=2719988 RepID=A0A968GA79_9SPIO|nr:hypothetical protein [Entomospira entomophilus]NIZ39938.1 hypothetical protein [Entomospira entomophilus]WDI35499.1 hypothetical protein PVA45_00170 [Entomospira entomophilus]
MSKSLTDYLYYTILIVCTTLLSIPRTYAQEVSNSLIQQYDLLSQQIEQSTKLSAQDLWIMLQASYLIGDFQESKRIIPLLLKHASHKYQAQSIQLYIAIQEKDKNLAKLLSQAQRNPLFKQSVPLSLQEAEGWLQTHSSKSQKSISDWSQIKEDPTILLSKHDKQPKWSPLRVIIERQLINIYIQAKDLSALSSLLPQLTLTKDKVATQLSIAQLTNNKEEQYQKLEQLSQQSFIEYRIKANIALLLLHIERGSLELIPIIQQRLLSDRVDKKSVYYQISLAITSFLESDYAKVIATISQVAQQKSFKALPDSLQIYLYELRAFSYVKTNQITLAQKAYEQISQHPTAPVSTQINSILVQSPLSWQTQELILLQDHAVNQKKQQLLAYLRSYHAYTSSDMKQMKQLLQTHPESEYYPDILHTLYALLYQYQNHFLLSANHFQKVSNFTKQEHSKAQALLLSAQNYLQINQITTAHTQLLTLMALDDHYKEYIDVQFLLAQVLLQLKNQRKEVLDLLESCYRLIQQPVKNRKESILLEEPSMKEIFLLYYQIHYESSPTQASEILSEIRKKHAHLAKEIMLDYAQILFNQGLYLAAIEHFKQYLTIHTTMSPLEKSAIIYQIALSYELIQNNQQAKLYYIEYLEKYPQAPHTMASARRLIRLYSTKERINLLSNPPSWMTQPIKLIFFLAEQSQKTTNIQLSKEQLQWLEQIDTATLETQEAINLLRLLAYFYEQQDLIDQALHFWYLVIEQSKDKHDHWEARKIRSRIYEEQGILAKAVQEWTLLATTLKPWPKEAYQAYMEAHQLCIKHHMYPQADIIYNRILNEFPEFIQ